MGDHLLDNGFTKRGGKNSLRDDVINGIMWAAIERERERSEGFLVFGVRKAWGRKKTREKS